MWVALAGARVVGFRAFLRWEFVGPSGRVRHAARAVDTATDPDFEGRGIFTRLTLEALDALPAEGVDTRVQHAERAQPPRLPQDGVGRRSGRLRRRRPSHPVAVRRAWSGPPGARRGEGSCRASVGVPAGDGLADRGDRSTACSRTAPAPLGLATRRSGRYLHWRYGNPDLGYRLLVHGPPAAPDGLLVFRLRRRGAAVEGVVDDLVAPRGSPEVARALVDRLARAHAADYLIRLQQPRVTRDRFVRLPQVGPILVCRSLTDIPVPDLRGWAPSMGDVELL